MSNFYIQPKNLRAPTNLGDKGYTLSSRGESFLASTAESFDTVVGLYNSTIGDVWANHSDKTRGESVISKEYVNNYNEQYGLNLSFRENEMPSQFELRLDKALKNNLRATRINKKYSGTNMVGSFAGELVNPINYIPGIGVANKLRQGASGLAKTQIAISRGKKLSAAFESVKDTAAYSIIGNAAVEPLYVREAALYDKEYTLSDSFANIGLGAAVGTTLFGPLNAYLAFGKASRNIRSIQNFEEMHSFMETGQFGKAASVLYNNNPEFRKQVSKAKEFADFVKEANESGNPINFTNLDRESLKKLNRMIYTFHDEGLKNALNNAMTEEVIEQSKINKNLKITEVLDAQRNDYLKVYTAIRSNTVDRLSSTQKAIAEKVLNTVEGLKGSTLKKFVKSKLNDVNTQLDASTFTQQRIANINTSSGEIDLPSYTQRVNNDFIPNDPDLSKSRIELNKSRRSGFVDDIKNLLPVDQTRDGEFNIDGMLSTLLTRIDVNNKGVDPDSTDLISYGEYKATIKEIFEDAISDTDLRAMYNLVKDLYRDEITQPNAQNNFEIKRRIKQLGADKKQDILYDHYSNKIIDVVANAAKKKKILDIVNQLPKSKRIKALRTMLDGQDRPDLTAQAGLEVEMITASQEAAVPLFDVLAKYDLLELFLADNSWGIFKAFRDKGYSEKWKLFGRNQKRASKEFHRQLHNAMLARTLPEKWKNNEGLTELFKVLMATEMRVLKDLNASGIKIDIARDFGGISQKWDSEVIYRMGEDSFKKRMREVIDVPEVKRRLGNIMIVDGKELEFDFEVFLTQWYKSLDPAKRGGDNDPQFDLNNTFQSRNIVVKKEFATDIALEFSGYDSIGHLVFQQIQRRAGLAVMAKFAGTKPATLLKEVASEIEGGSEADRLWFEKTVDGMTGILDNPVDVDVHAHTRTIKQLSDILFLSGSGISSLTDIPNAISTLEMLGVPFAEQNKNFWSSWKRNVTSKIGKEGSGMRNYFMGLGAGFDVLNNAVVRRLSDTRTGGGSLLDRMHNLVFKLNGLNSFTTASQEMFVDILTQAMPDLISRNNSDMIRSLTEFGFNKTEIKQLGSKTITTSDGYTRLDYYKLNPKTLRKFRQFVTKYMRQGVMVPDVGTRVQARLGLRSGTKFGAMVEVATQYQSFMLGMSKTIYRRFANGLNGSTGNRATMQKTAHLISFISGAIAFGYMATVLKDLAKGKEPITFADMTTFEFTRILRQSGILGVLETPINMAQFGPMEALSPMADTLLGIPVDAATFDVKGLGNAMQDLTGQNIYGPPQWFHGMIAEGTAEFTNEIQNNLLNKD